MSEREPITLMNLGGGAAVELFAREFEAVLKNIADPNTPATATRKITLEVSLKPSERRDQMGIEISAQSKVPAFTGFATTGYVGNDALGRRVAVEFNPKQGAFDFGGVPANVTVIKEGTNDK